MALSARAKQALRVALADAGAADEIIGLLNAEDAEPGTDPSTAIADLTAAATTGTLPTPNGSVTIANATTGISAAETLEFLVELNAKVVAINAVLEEQGLTA